MLGEKNESGIRYLVDPRVVEGTRWVTGADVDGSHVIDLVAGRDFTPDGTIEAAEVRDGDACPNCDDGTLEAARGIEMGHIFQLGRKYADALDLKVLDENGKLVTVTMGSYGIGPSRAVAAIAEGTHDELGLCWPREVAPADVHLVATGKDEAVFAAAERIAHELAAQGIEVLYDDRPQGQPRREVQGRRADRRPHDRGGRQGPRRRHHRGQGPGHRRARGRRRRRASSTTSWGWCVPERPTPASTPSSSTGAAPSPAGTTSTSTRSRSRSPRRWSTPTTTPTEVTSRLHAAGEAIWGRSRDHQQSSTVADLFDEAGLDHDPDLLTAYYEFWEPHTLTDPEVGPLFEALRADGLKVGVLSNTIWPRAWHESFFERDGVRHLIDGDVYTSEIPWTKPSRAGLPGGHGRPSASTTRPAASTSATGSSTTSGAPATPGCGRSTSRSARSRRARSATPRASRTRSRTRLADIPGIVAAWT